MTHDISNFMTWFIGEVVKIFTSFFNILDSIQFSGTSLLKICIVVLIFSALFPVILTLSQSVSTFTSISEKRHRNAEKAKRKDDKE